MLFGELCVAKSVNFSHIPTSEGSRGVEERTQKFWWDERSEYEPKANKYKCLL